MTDEEKALDIIEDNHTRIINYDYTDEELGKAQEIIISALYWRIQEQKKIRQKNSAYSEEWGNRK